MLCLYAGEMPGPVREAGKSNGAIIQSDESYNSPYNKSLYLAAQKTLNLTYEKRQINLYELCFKYNGNVPKLVNENVHLRSKIS